MKDTIQYIHTNQRLHEHTHTHTSPEALPSPASPGTEPSRWRSQTVPPSSCLHITMLSMSLLLEELPMGQNDTMKSDLSPPSALAPYFIDTEDEFYCRLEVIHHPRNTGIDFLVTLHAPLSNFTEYHKRGCFA